MLPVAMDVNRGGLGKTPRKQAQSPTLSREMVAPACVSEDLGGAGEKTRGSTRRQEEEGRVNGGVHPEARGDADDTDEICDGGGPGHGADSASEEVTSASGEVESSAVSTGPRSSSVAVASTIRLPPGQSSATAESAPRPSSDIATLLSTPTPVSTSALPPSSTPPHPSSPPTSSSLTLPPSSSSSPQPSTSPPPPPRSSTPPTPSSSSPPTPSTPPLSSTPPIPSPSPSSSSPPQPSTSPLSSSPPPPPRTSTPTTLSSSLSSSPPQPSTSPLSSPPPPRTSTSTTPSSSPSSSPSPSPSPSSPSSSSSSPPQPSTSPPPPPRTSTSTTPSSSPSSSPSPSPSSPSPSAADTRGPVSTTAVSAFSDDDDFGEFEAAPSHTAALGWLEPRGGSPHSRGVAEWPPETVGGLARELVPSRGSDAASRGAVKALVSGSRDADAAALRRALEECFSPEPTTTTGRCAEHGDSDSRPAADETVTPLTRHLLGETPAGDRVADNGPLPSSVWPKLRTVEDGETWRMPWATSHACRQLRRALGAARARTPLSADEEERIPDCPEEGEETAARPTKPWDLAVKKETMQEPVIHTRVTAGRYRPRSADGVVTLARTPVRTVFGFVRPGPS